MLYIASKSLKTAASAPPSFSSYTVCNEGFPSPPLPASPPPLILVVYRINSLHPVRFESILLFGEAPSLPLELVDESIGGTLGEIPDSANKLNPELLLPSI
jgi:hypothetical protein